MQTISYADSGLAPLIEALRRRDGSACILFAGATEAQRAEALNTLTEKLSYNLHQVDLAQLIGDRPIQTQGNLREVFDNASEQASLLVLNQADPLFDTLEEREADTDEHTPVDYLFERIAAFPGIVVVSLQNADLVRAAAAHGADFVVEFA